MEKEEVWGGNHGSGAGYIHVVGIGPGHLSMLTIQARQAILNAEVIIGYNTYLSLIEPLLAGKEIISTGMTRETERAGMAVEFASKGKKVVVVSGGDAGIYGMAGLLLEVSWPCRIPVEIIPGITAASSAAALLGAPLMHDFAAVSLSDLLTPWDVIEKRLVAAAAGDFVIVLYNPASHRRRKQIVRAREILLQHREASTPVGIVRNAYREDQETWITNLENVLSYRLDMFTTIVVGNSETFQQGNYMVTPRGYKLHCNAGCSNNTTIAAAERGQPG